MYDLGLLIKKLRNKNNYTQEYVAKKLNVTPATISKWELNYQMPSCEKLIELAAFFNVTLNYLAGLEKEKSIIIEDLSDKQIEIINTLLTEFRNKDFRDKKSGLTPRQLEIINLLMIEFNK